MVMKQPEASAQPRQQKTIGQSLMQLRSSTPNVVLCIHYSVTSLAPCRLTKILPIHVTLFSIQIEQPYLRLAVKISSIDTKIAAQKVAAIFRSSEFFKLTAFPPRWYSRQVGRWQNRATPPHVRVHDSETLYALTYKSCLFLG